jgi:hypothetical protein
MTIIHVIRYLDKILQILQYISSILQEKRRENIFSKNVLVVVFSCSYPANHVSRVLMKIQSSL